MIRESNQEVIMKALSKPFPPELVRTRVGRKSTKKDKATILFYIDARHVMQRLDDVVGIMSWQHEFKAWKTDEQLCGISILVRHNIITGDALEWVTKWDGADATAVEATKGGLSDSFKRAAVHWGIGRYLYDCKGILHV